MPKKLLPWIGSDAWIPHLPRKLDFGELFLEAALSIFSIHLTSCLDSRLEKRERMMVPLLSRSVSTFHKDVIRLFAISERYLPNLDNYLDLFYLVQNSKYPG